MRLWLQRHAQVLCEPGLCYGRTDVGAEPESTQRAAQALAQQLPSGICIWTSPRSRCLDLARALSALRPDLGPVCSDARLAEMDFGAWEGRPWGALARAEFEAWMADFGHARAGASGESTEHFMARIAQAFDEIRCTNRDAVWITHAGVMRAVQLLRAGVRRVQRADQWPAHAIAYGECQQVHLAPL